MRMRFGEVYGHVVCLHNASPLVVMDIISEKLEHLEVECQDKLFGMGSNGASIIEG